MVEYMRYCNRQVATVGCTNPVICKPKGAKSKTRSIFPNGGKSLSLGRRMVVLGLDCPMDSDRETRYACSDALNSPDASRSL